MNTYTHCTKKIKGSQVLQLISYRQLSGGGLAGDTDAFQDLTVLSSIMSSPRRVDEEALFQPCQALASIPELLGELRLCLDDLLPLFFHVTDGLLQRLHDNDGILNRVKECRMTCRHTSTQPVCRHHGNTSSDTISSHESIAAPRHGLLVGARMQRGSKGKRNKWLPL